MIKRGQIVLVSFPFADLQTKKVRPAVVVSSDSFNTMGSDAIFIFVTSKQYDGPFDIRLDEGTPEFQTTKLKMPSTLRVSKVMCLEQDLVKRRLGYLDDKTSRKVEQALMQLFELNRYHSRPPNQGK